MRSYDCSQRQVIEDVTRGDFAQRAATLAEQLAGERMQAIVGIARRPVRRHRRSLCAAP